MENTDGRVRLLGAPGSPYTRKMLAILRYRRIPHVMLWGGHPGAPEGLPEPKVKLLPTFYFPRPDGGIDAVVDSTPIIRKLEHDFAGRSVIPTDPALGFLNYLIEDYGDEWMTKAMFHYRWFFDADIANAAKMLVFWRYPSLPRDDAEKAGRQFAERQINRLYVVGSNETTAKTIESSYERLLAAMDSLVARQSYVLGGRPSSADYAIYGQLTQLAVVDPTPAAIASQKAPRVRAWVDLVDDLSGASPAEEDWLPRDAARESLAPLLNEIGRTYAPFLLANASAAANGDDTFETEIDGRAWTQPTFPYQAKCLKWIQEAFGDLSPDDQRFVRGILDGTGCEQLLPA